jgi:dTDP-4-amino-4,6-dideoxygalactose transaminase
MDRKIPFNRPSHAGNESSYMAEALSKGHLSGDGYFTKKCHELFERELGVRRALLTTSCTHALEMAALLVNIQPGDEVILPSFTFVSCVNAFVLRGAKPVFVDIRKDTLNLDESKVEEKLTKKTKAILAVHYAGVSCEMDALLNLAERHQIPLIEDNAHGLFGKYKGKYLGTLGAMATQSFHETKNFTCGEGGALLLNDAKHIERAEIIREKGTNRSRFFRGQVDKYTWVDLGSSYLPSDLLAGFLLAQLEEREKIQRQREKLWSRYAQALSHWAQKNDVRLPFVPEHCEQAFHMFYLLLPSLSRRQALIEHLKRLGITSVFHYLPLHLSDMGVSFGGKPGDCPVTEAYSDQLLRLPFYNSLTDEEQSFVIDSVLSF